MGKKDKRVDAYISNAESFAQPVLRHIRKLVHRACPTVQETMKWSFPNFVYRGILCSMAAFKNHCAFGFWKASRLTDFEKPLSNVGETAMGNFGRLTGISDLPADTILTKYIREAARLNEAGVKAPKKPKSRVKKELVIPGFFTKVLANNKKALNTFEAFSHTNKKEYGD